MELLIMKFSPTSYHFIPLPSKYTTVLLDFFNYPYYFSPPLLQIIDSSLYVITQRLPVAWFCTTDSMHTPGWFSKTESNININ
jgi:hypothetical protein